MSQKKTHIQIRCHPFFKDIVSGFKSNWWEEWRIQILMWLSIQVSKIKVQSVRVKNKIDFAA